jgi:acyl carrier protein
MSRDMTLQEIVNDIKKFIFQNYLFGFEEDKMGNEVSLLEMGVIDSTGIIELIMFIEENFAIEVPDHEIVPENLDSINYISEYVYKKLQVM